MAKSRKDDVGKIQELYALYKTGVIEKEEFEQMKDALPKSSTDLEFRTSKKGVITAMNCFLGNP